MPIYEYLCPANGRTVEVHHSMNARAVTWGQLCELAQIALGDTPSDAPVERLLFVPAISAPAGDSKLKEMGFTKLVKRDTGVYENVTALDSEKRYMNAGDPTSLPDLSKRIHD